MRARTFAVVLVALLTVLAGCIGTTSPTGTDGDQPEGLNAIDVQRDTDGGAVNFWISDERNDINDFEHLNVTITKVAFHKAGTDDDESEGNESEADEETDAEDNESEIDGNESETDSGPPEDRGPGADDDGGPGNGGPPADSPDWVVREVDTRPVDLTRLQGENATLLGAFNVPEGRYDKVFLYVDGINATLNGSGESANVKLPSGRLHLNQGFTVGANSSPDFVFDISVIKAGNSGMYILKPVASQSGTDVPIRDADSGDVPPEDAGPPNDVGPPGDRGNGNGPPEHAGPPEDRGNGDGPPEDRGNGNGPPDDVGPPEDRGNGNGPPEHAGPPEDRGNGDEPPKDREDESAEDGPNGDDEDSQVDDDEENESEGSANGDSGGTDGTAA